MFVHQLVEGAKAIMEEKGTKMLTCSHLYVQF